MRSTPTRQRARPPALNLALALAAAAALLPGPARAAGPRTLELDAALAELDAGSPGLTEARARAAEATALVRQAAAPLLPTLVATGSYTLNSDEVRFARVDPGPPPVATTIWLQPREAFAAGGTLRVPLLVPTAWADLAAARHAAASAEAQAEAARTGLRLALVQGAWMAASAEAIVRSAESALTASRGQAVSARRAADAGLQPRLASLQADAQALRRESDVARARGAQEKAWLALGVLLGRAEPVRIRLPERGAPAAEDAAALGTAALERRPETRARAEAVAAAESQRSAARARLLPQVSASASAFAQDVPYPTGQKDGWRALVELSWPLYDGGLRYGKGREAEARISGARAAAEAQRLAILQEVEDAVRDRGVAAEQLRLAARQREVSAEAAATAHRGFDAGTTSSVDALAADEALFLAEVAEADARARLGAAGAALDRAAGRL